MNKYKLLNLVALCWMLLIAPSMLIAADDQHAADRETARLTAKLLIGELKKKLIKSPVKPGVMQDEMSTHKEKYHSSAESKGPIKMFVQKELAAQFEKDVRGILKSLDSNLPEGLNSWFDENDLKSFLAFPKEEVLSSLDKKFDKMYNSERRKACNAQWKGLTTDVYPTEEEFVGLESRELYDLLLRRVLTKQKEPLFEESERYLKAEFIRPIIDDAQAQLNLQIKVLSESSGGNGKLPVDIGVEIREELEAARRSLRKKKANKKIGGKVYAIFKMVEDKISYRSKDVAATKFVEYMNKSTFSINAATIKMKIDNDLAGHKLRKTSLAECVNAFNDEIRERALHSYVEDVADNGGKFRIFLSRLLDDGQQVNDAAKSLVERSLDEGFVQARELIVDSQMNDFFTPLKSGNWRASDDLIEKSYYTNKPIPIADPLGLPGISAGAFNRNLLLEETSSAVLAAVLKSIDEGKRAMRAQYGVVDSIEQRIFAEMDKLKRKEPDAISRVMFTYFKRESLGASFKDVSDTQKIISFYKQRFLRIWKQQKVDLIWTDKKTLPDNYSIKYSLLLPAVQTDIARRVKAIMHNEDDYLAERKKIDPTQFTQVNLQQGGGTSKKAGKGTGSGAGIGTGTGEIDSDVMIDVKYAGNDVEISLAFANRKYPVKVVFDRNDYELELDRIVDAFDEWITTNAVKGEEVRMDVVMRIFNTDIHYGLVAEIRRKLKHQVAKKHSQTINIQWTDMLYTGEE